jgi:transposase InsO family protein
VVLLPALDCWAAPAAMASTSVERPWCARGSSPGPGSHRLRPRSTLQRHALCSASLTAAGRLGSGRTHRCPEPNVALGVHPLGAGHRCHLPHVVLGWYTPIPTPPPASSITVGNSCTIPITCRGKSTLSTPNSTFRLTDVLIAPSLVRNLLSVRQFTRDNNCFIEFDAFGFSVKDHQTGRVILRCNSDSDLYNFPSPSVHHCSLAVTTTLWHHRLGHLGSSSLATLQSMSVISCNKCPPTLCHACQLGKHVRLPFNHSTSMTTAPFDLVHCDVWTSPILSTSGFKYYLILLDDFSHYCWSFPLRHKSEVHRHIVDFIAYAQTQFATTPKSFQADNGTEFVNTATTSYLASCGISLRLSCPYTSAQNGKAERMLRTTNNTIRTMLLHAFMPPSYWAEALATATFLLNRRPSSSIG